MPARFRRRRITALVVTAVLATAACSTSSKGSPGGAGSRATSGTVAASATGVTADTIKIGFSHIDLETLAKSGIIKIDHGPYEQIVTALVNDVNARGGVNGRKLQLFTAKYSPIGNTEQLAACTKLTEDDKVFAVLNGFLTTNNLCVTQQHSTILVGGNLNQSLLSQSRAPWATYTPSDERAINALVQVLDKNGHLKGHTIAVYAAQVANKPLLDLGVKTLKDAGYEVADVALNDAPDNDQQAATALDKTIAERMMNKHVDTVLDVGQFIPAADFDAAGFHPSLYSLSTGNIAAAAFTNPLAKFPIVAGLEATADPNGGYNTAEMQRCRQVWKQATGQDIETTQQETAAGKSTGNVAMSIACTTLQIFVKAAKAAGQNLNSQSWQKGLESIGPIELANTPTASFGPNKPDGQDSFQLAKHDPAWTTKSPNPEFLPIGAPITLTK